MSTYVPISRVFIKYLLLSLILVWGASAHAQVNVVASFSVLSDLVKNVGGDKVHLITLVGADCDAHNYEPVPQDSVHLHDADIIFTNGFNFEHWMDDLYQASGSKALRVAVAESDIKPRRMGDGLEVDPHVWHDVLNVIVMVRRIAQVLGQVDQANASYFQQRAQHYIETLEELDQWVVSQVGRLSLSQRTLITSHDTFGYFATRYGFNVIGTAIESTTTEASDPSMKAVKELIDTIKQQKVPVVFIENVANPKLMANIAREAGVKIAPALYTDALGLPNSLASDYISMMKYNVTTMVESLAQ